MWKQEALFGVVNVVCQINASPFDLGQPGHWEVQCWRMDERLVICLVMPPGQHEVLVLHYSWIHAQERNESVCRTSAA